MSWFSELASKAEGFLNNLDSSAAEVLNAKMNVQKPSTSDDSHLSFYSYEDELVTGYSDRSRLIKNEPTGIGGKYQPSAINYSSPVSEVYDKELTDENERSRIEKPDLFTFLDSPQKSTFKSHERVNLPSSKQSSIYSMDLNDEEVPSSSGYETFKSADIDETRQLATSSNPISNTQADSIAVHYFATEPTTSEPPSKCSVQHNLNDLRVENKILRSEVSSMSQEVSGLLRRNHKASEENKHLLGQIEHLTNQLRDSDNRVRELQVQLRSGKLAQLNDSSRSSSYNQLTEITDKLRSTQTELALLQSQLDVTKESLTNTEANLRESRQQVVLANKRADLAQTETNRLSNDLAQYKEKANQILTMKERVIASLRGQDTSDNSGDASMLSNEDGESVNVINPNETTLIKSMRAECDLLREEATRWRLEVEHREMAVQELELQMQAERASLHRNLELIEQQSERERKLREDSDTELVQCRKHLRDLEESLGRQKADLHAQLMASESEMNRLRQLLGESRNSHERIDSTNSTPLRADPKNIVTLESRIRQLTDNLLSKQDSLESVLAQNHVLKIRLERLQNDNESLTMALSSNDNDPMRWTSGKSFQTRYGCARLNLQSTPLPRSAKIVAQRMDSFGITITDLIRRWPMLRLFLIFYLSFLHIWIMVVIVMAVPSENLNTQNPKSALAAIIPNVENQ